MDRRINSNSKRLFIFSSMLKIKMFFLLNILNDEWHLHLFISISSLSLYSLSNPLDKYRFERGEKKHRIGEIVVVHFSLISDQNHKKKNQQL